jgi:hypothetical protein
MSNAMQRTKELIDIGLLPMSGEIVKHRQFVNGVPTSYVSVNLNFVLPEDLEIVIKILQSETEKVKTEWQETVKMLTS